MQKQLIRLEADGVVVSRAIGKLREYELNPRYPFLQPLKALLKTGLAAYPKNLQNALALTRERPRKAEKKLNRVKDGEL